MREWGWGWGRGGGGKSGWVGRYRIMLVRIVAIVLRTGKEL